MGIPIYLAMTDAEFLNCTALPPKIGWMSCHFSSSDDGLCNLPDRLPDSSLLILDDSTPYQDHNCERILSQLHDAINALQVSALLLDFQRPGNAQLAALTSAIVKHLSCPVAVSSCYAGELACPIFLPPGPLYQHLSDYLKLFRNREIWLDAAPVCAQMIITSESSQYIPQVFDPLDDFEHFDTALHCRYRAKVEENQIIFTLSRGCEELSAWLTEAEALGVKCAVGLFQELGGISY